LIRLLSENYVVLILAQYLLGYLSIVSFYRTGVMLSSVQTSLLATILFLLFIDTSFWSSYILVESFYLSSLCFAFYFLARWYKGNLNGPYVLLLLVACVIAFFAKPTSIALIAALVASILFTLIKRIASKKANATLGIIGFLLLMILANKMLGTFTLIENYKTGEIVYAMSTFPDHPNYNQVMVSVPDDLYIPEMNHFPIVRLAEFVIHNPVYWSELFFKKVAYSLAHIRPYWSTIHNAYMLILLIPIYLFAARAVIMKLFPTEIIVFVLTYFLIHLLIFGCTTVDWDGRFFLPLVPVLTFMAAVGFFNNSKVAIKNTTQNGTN
jgi:4-amino-4-deoxy-L-arabinose transferase-like glycosyltransferase